VRVTSSVDMGTRRQSWREKHYSQEVVCTTREPESHPHENGNNFLSDIILSSNFHPGGRPKSNVTPTYSLSFFLPNDVFPETLLDKFVLDEGSKMLARHSYN
jgi:hypothetical protein